MARWLVLGLTLGLAMAARAGAPAPEAAAVEKPEARPWSLDLTVQDFGLGIDNSEHVDGLRLNFRDAAPYTVHGLSVTVWTGAAPASRLSAAESESATRMS